MAGAGVGRSDHQIHPEHVQNITWQDCSEMVNLGEWLEMQRWELFT